jgi:hypothetical protein
MPTTGNNAAHAATFTEMMTGFGLSITGWKHPVAHDAVLY